MVGNFLKDGGQLPQDLSRDPNLAAALIEALTTKVNVPVKGTFRLVRTRQLPEEHSLCLPSI